MSHSLLHQPVVTSAPLVRPVRTTTATFPSHMPNVCYANAPIRSFSSKLKTTSSLQFSLSFHQKCAPTAAGISPYSPYLACVSSPPVTTLSISSQKKSGRAASIPPSFLLSSIVVSSVNSLSSSYVVRTKPLSFKTTKSLVLKSLSPHKTSICINSSVSGTVSDAVVSDSTNTSCVALVQHPVSNSKQVVDVDSFNSGNNYLSSLSKFSSFVTTECSPTFLFLLVSFLALCYSCLLLLIFYLVFLTFLTRCFLLTQSNCVIFFTIHFTILHFTIHFSSDFIFYETVHQFSKALNLRLFASQNLRNTTIFSIY